eukprot:CAMPEP_0179976500 /NCGR_PEP_ID=MMETSP0983-20121128/39416_1 /TAXON_ID=483367 /ORGANISM="non described non described, Strain CCMP 2436" /LENGTH=65 /DNA_ID=CAMNT_0021893339 /DNA_START=41 /DNA_END=235 /DNA_ORIENTATION=+
MIHHALPRATPALPRSTKTMRAIHHALPRATKTTRAIHPSSTTRHPSSTTLHQDNEGDQQNTDVA